MRAWVLNSTRHRKRVPIIVIKRSFFFLYNCSLKTPSTAPVREHLESKPQLSCTHGITLMFALDPERKIRLRERPSILKADSEREQRMVYCEPHNCWGGGKKREKRAWSVCRTRSATPAIAVSLIRASPPCKGAFLMRCCVCSRWGASSSIRRKQEAASAGPSHCLAGSHRNETELNIGAHGVVLHHVHC